MPWKLWNHVQEVASPHEEREHLSLPKAFIAKQEESEEEESYLYEGLKVKGLMALVTEATDGSFSRCDIGPYQAVRESEIKIKELLFYSSGLGARLVLR